MTHPKGETDNFLIAVNRKNFSKAKRIIAHNIWRLGGYAKCFFRNPLIEIAYQDKINVDFFEHLFSTARRVIPNVEERNKFLSDIVTEDHFIFNVKHELFKMIIDEDFLSEEYLCRCSRYSGQKSTLFYIMIGYRDTRNFEYIIEKYPSLLYSILTKTNHRIDENIIDLPQGKAVNLLIKMLQSHPEIFTNHDLLIRTHDTYGLYNYYYRNMKPLSQGTKLVSLLREAELYHVKRLAQMNGLLGVVGRIMCM